MRPLREPPRVQICAFEQARTSVVLAEYALGSVRSLTPGHIPPRTLRSAPRGCHSAGACPLLTSEGIRLPAIGCLALA
jgi:hypothetical protein